ncbi:tandem C2 domains nuclear protein [Erpetoichthys calabaricus]|uniref:Tandem C2 domains, nuclear n=1 Tax=Erpetoichthys calabaricus TaxID=27687 RepID=A0A8C4SVU5_ERPCA|nr:tandem C2 domains nuclear protein [Erpetoichthys calabaricus]XP_028677667.1 tandem C2 domains nuclear protein [Erpetoichthys calabaricus]
MSTEFIKSCCKGLLCKDEGPESQDTVVSAEAVKSWKSVSETEKEKSPVTSPNQKNIIGCTEDYLLSKIPPDGRQIPFIVPTFRPSYIQPFSQLSPGYADGLPGPARSMFSDRKAELTTQSQLNHDFDVVYHPSYMMQHISPGTIKRLQNEKGLGTYGSVWDQKGGKQVNHAGLTCSVFDLASQRPHFQRYDSVSSVQSSASSKRDSQGSNRSLDAINLSGDERELGKLNLWLSYQTSLEQIWITIVRCKDMYLPMSYGDQNRVSIKGIITLPKPVQFKTSIKEGLSDMEFMETFVFSLKLQQLQTVALVLKIYTHNPRKRTLGECTLSLRDLGAVETHHWLDITIPPKAPTCHAELQIGACFQPASSRILFQILAAQNLPSPSMPLSLSFFVKVEMHNVDGLVSKKKTRILKPSTGQKVKWNENFLFPLSQNDQGVQFIIRLYSRSSVRRKNFLGQIQIGWDSSSGEGAAQWKDATSNPEKTVVAWHMLNVT